MPTLEITTMVGCPLMCSFCPQTGLKAAYDKNQKYLSFDDFKCIINKVPKHLRIDFAGMSEPWANKNCTEMLRYALDMGFKVGIYSTLYGMTEDDSDIVIGLLQKYSAQVDVLCLHLPDSNGNMRGWKYSQEWENVFIKFRRLKNEKAISRFEMMTMDGSGRVHDSLIHLNIKLGRWIGLTRAGSLDESKINEQNFYKRTPHHNAAVTCRVTPFYDHNVVLPNGDVSVCCMDYNLKHIIGNLLTQDYCDLFKSDGMMRLRQANMAPEFSECSICKSCAWAATYSIGADARWSRDRRKLIDSIMDRLRIQI